jgi:hypothetical protein
MKTTIETTHSVRTPQAILLAVKVRTGWFSASLTGRRRLTE